MRVVSTGFWATSSKREGKIAAENQIMYWMTHELHTGKEVVLKSRILCAHARAFNQWLCPGARCHGDACVFRNPEMGLKS
jgi:hypothetical protein